MFKKTQTRIWTADNENDKRNPVIIGIDLDIKFINIRKRKIRKMLHPRHNF
jgi:hypothetical protein